MRTFNYYTDEKKRDFQNPPTYKAFKPNFFATWVREMKCNFAFELNRTNRQISAFVTFFYVQQRFFFHGQLNAVGKATSESRKNAGLK